MRLEKLERIASQDVDLDGKRLLIFIVAYNAETTIEKGPEPHPCRVAF